MSTIGLVGGEKFKSLVIKNILRPRHFKETYKQINLLLKG